jgi:SAM-dependent methyltransferase/methyltransferase-like protein
MPSDPPPAFNSYDAIPYLGLPCTQTHPGAMAAVAKILSVAPPEPRQCRVLELGCCDGGNLMSMAIGLPGSTFLGIDYSPVQIDIGKQRIASIGLKNVELRTQSILELTPALGRFDYIIAHGVFSWVNDAVREKLLEMTAKLLAPAGIAYISYNTLPGWHLRGIVRELMLYHAHRFPDPDKRFQEARAIVDFVAHCAAGPNTEGYIKVLRAEAEMIRQVPDFYLAHEHFSENCDPFYFNAFVTRARRHGLEYFADAMIGTMLPTGFGPVAAKALSAVSSNFIEMEQFMDFLRNRSFRQSLLRPAGSPSPSYEIEPAKLAGLYIKGSMQPKATVDLRPDQPMTFERAGTAPITTTHAFLKAALLCLGDAYPHTVQFETLIDQTRARLAAAGITDAKVHVYSVGSALLQLLATTEFIDLSAVGDAFTATSSAIPLASPLARAQTASGPAVSTLAHNTVTLEPLEVRVLAQLDGTRNVDQIAAELATPLAEVRRIIETLAKHALLMPAS